LAADAITIMPTTDSSSSTGYSKRARWFLRL
jgi:hypothetical protein